jgi:hypothetical protein
VVVLTTQQDDPGRGCGPGRRSGALLLHAAAQGVQAQPLGRWWTCRAARGLAAAARG